MDDKHLDDAIKNALQKRHDNHTKMHQWDKECQHKRNTLFRLSAITSAAVIAAVIGLSAWWLFNGTQRTDEPTVPIAAELYRGADCRIPEIDDLIDSGDLAEALSCVTHLESRYTDEIKLIDDLKSPSEEQAYEKAVAENMIYNIGWRKIQLLIALDSIHAARPIVREYCFKIGPHQSEAHKLWRQLK